MLRVQAKPNSKASEVVEINEDYVKIALKARPIEGEANNELISFLSNALSVEEEDIDIKRGETSKCKTVSITKINKSDE